MAKTRQTSEARQRQLIDAALHIIATQGIAALSTRSLASEVGLSSGAIFRHFSSIDALLEALVSKVEAVLDSTFPASDLPPKERLITFVEARSKAVSGQLGIMRLVLSEQFLLALPNKGPSRLAACVRKTRKFVLTCLRDGQQTRDFRDDVDAAALTTIVMGTIQVLALSSTSKPFRGPKAQTVRACLLTVLAPPPTTRPTTRQKKAS